MRNSRPCPDCSAAKQRAEEAGQHLDSIKDMHARIISWPPVDVASAFAVVAQTAAWLARNEKGKFGTALLKALDQIKAYISQREADADAQRQRAKAAETVLRDLREHVQHQEAGHTCTLTAELRERVIAAN